MTRRSSALLAFALWTLTPTAIAEPLRLPAIFSDHLVLQRERFVPVWGWASPGQVVRVQGEWSDEASQVVADDAGRWRTWLRTPEAGGPYTLTVRSEDEIRVLRDILIGEVWLCSGQSNMEMTVANTAPGYQGVLDWEAEVAAAHHPKLRRIEIPNVVSLTPKDDCEAQWVVCSPETAGDFSATAYFFARKVMEELDIPVGLVSSDWGGTVAEAWTSAAGLAPLGDFADALADAERERSQSDDLDRDQAEKRGEWWATLDRKAPGAQTIVWAKEREPFSSDAWKPMNQPAEWGGTELRDFDGIVWLRRRFTVSAEQARQEVHLHLGAIDDMDTTFINGERVAGTEVPDRWTEPRQYPIPVGVLHPGVNEIAVRVVDTGGGGGFTGTPEQLALHFTDGTAPVSLAGEWHARRGVAASELPPWPRVRRFTRDSPTALFNGQLAPVAPYGIRGALWYQGESNRPRAAQYARLMPAMIQDWRHVWGQGDFPFYFVQIAPYAYGRDQGQAAELRDAQRTTLRVPNTGMAVTMDIGNARDIHPKNKQEVGRRLALWALNQTYGLSDIVYSGPLYRSMEIEKESMRIRFDHVAGGLVCRGESLTHFTIAGADHAFHPAQARIDGETIVVWSEAVPEPVAVRFGWGAADEPNLFNAAGLPASSFRTDEWPMLTQ